MTRLEWQRCYEVGNERIDAEHKIFFGLIQKLAADAAEGRDPDRIGRTLSEILKYGEFHFLSEENMMIDEGYPGYVSHRRLHEALLSELHHQYRTFRISGCNVEQVVEFVFDWFVKHTVSEDIKIGNYLASRDTSARPAP